MLKLKIKWGKVFIGAMLLLGGGICILVPATTLQDRFLVISIILGVTLVMTGIVYIWEATEDIRVRQREKRIR